MLPDHHTGEATRNLFDSDEALLVHLVNDETLGVWCWSRLKLKCRRVGWMCFRSQLIEAKPY